MSFSEFFLTELDQVYIYIYYTTGNGILLHEVLCFSVDICLPFQGINFHIKIANNFVNFMEGSVSCVGRSPFVNATVWLLTCAYFLTQGDCL